MRHVLVIGGTGMLADVSIYLASTADIFTSIASSDASLAKVDSMIARGVDSSQCIRHSLKLDWHDPTHFIDSIKAHLVHIGYPNTVLAWVHNTELGLKLVQLIADFRDTSSLGCNFFHVVGSASANPVNGQNTLRSQCEALLGNHYRQIILGFIIEHNRSRWLNHQEIATGVIHAMNTAEPISIIGTVEPWSLRP